MITAAIVIETGLGQSAPESPTGRCVAATTRPRIGRSGRRAGRDLLGPLGVRVLDGLGAGGEGAHAADEHVWVDSLEVRADLLARILREPAV